jgi:hypothetical protein
MGSELAGVVVRPAVGRWPEAGNARFPAAG